ncbi:hypothetical protein M1145_00625 [Patescibacteria group bacterium]|nr:hypothetical protein [Patescibacteria group bacterium]
MNIEKDDNLPPYSVDTEKIERQIRTIFDGFNEGKYLCATDEHSMSFFIGTSNNSITVLVDAHAPKIAEEDNKSLFTVILRDFDNGKLYRFTFCIEDDQDIEIMFLEGNFHKDSDPEKYRKLGVLVSEDILDKLLELDERYTTNSNVGLRGSLYNPGIDISTILQIQKMLGDVQEILIEDPL